MTNILYLDFDLQIERAEQGYRAQMVASPTGQASQSFTLPFSDAELENFLILAGRPRAPMRSGAATDVAAAQAFGGRLFETLFTHQMRDGLQSSLNEAERQGKGLRIRLRFNDAPELADIPWEYLYRADADRFLALSANTPLVRYLELPGLIHPLTVTPPLRILVVLASPRDFPPLDLEAEWNRLHTALQAPDARSLVTLDRLDHATITTLQTKLRQGEYHIFHFIGHGGFDAQTQDGMLMLEDERGNGSRTSGRDLGVLLHDSRTLRLALLNACEGGRSGRKNLFDGVAQSLVRQGIPAVIAMQFPVTDKAAIVLANAFYGALADNYPVDAALAEARKQIYTAGDNLEWGTPVLYLRTPDGQIFDIAARAPSPAPVTKSAPSIPGPLLSLRPGQRTWLALALIALGLVTAVALIMRRVNPGPGPESSGTNALPAINATQAASISTSDHQASTATVTLFPTLVFTSTAIAENPPTATVATVAAIPTLPVTPALTTLAVTATVKTTATLMNSEEWHEVLLLDRHAGAVNSATFSPDGKLIVTSGADHTARIWDAATGKQVTVLRDPNHTETSAVFSPDGMLLATTGDRVRIWQVRTWQPIDIQGTQLSGIIYVYHAAFSADGTLLATSAFQNLSLWAVGTWEQTLSRENPDYIHNMAFSPDGTQIVAALDDNTARVWDLKTGDTLAVLRGHTARLSDATYSPNGRLIVTTGYDDKTARIWDVATEQPLLVLKGYTNSVYTAVFTLDGQQIFTVSAEGTAQLWDAKTGTSVDVLRNPGMLSATFSLDGSHIITTNKDGTARVWAKAAVKTH